MSLGLYVHSSETTALQIVVLNDSAQDPPGATGTDVDSNRGCCHAAYGNQFGMQYIEYYRGVVLALAQGRQVTFDMAKSKPRVRQGKDEHGYSPRLKVVEQNRKHAAISRLLQRHPTLAAKYSVDTCQVPPL